jgi:hypothetical protein
VSPGCGALSTHPPGALRIAVTYSNFFDLKGVELREAGPTTGLKKNARRRSGLRAQFHVDHFAKYATAPRDVKRHAVNGGAKATISKQGRQIAHGLWVM